MLVCMFKHGAAMKVTEGLPQDARLVMTSMTGPNMIDLEVESDEWEEVSLDTEFTVYFENAKE